ncbi:MAG: hypothetical protein JXA15_06855 [Spirochaetales bacterium]|nr:hypothetical protein [Spirochaetales bacterium]
MKRNQRLLTACAAILATALAAVSCAPEGALEQVPREQLFTLSYGVLEDQLDLFRSSSAAAPAKTRLAMRDGIFFVTNGSSGKVLSFSSFGDLLSLVFDPERNPEPLSLEALDQGETGTGRVARRYPLAAPGEIAVGANGILYVEDRLPAERRLVDEDIGVPLDYVVLRFSREGSFLDFLGQEGLGGTPFPYIDGIYPVEGGGCMVVSMTKDGWLVFSFDADGALLSSVRIRRSTLPQPEGERLFANLEKIVADPDGEGAWLKIDYYRELVEKDTMAGSGVAYAGSRLYLMDLERAAYSESIELPSVEYEDDEPGSVPPIHELVGIDADGRIYLSATGLDGSFTVSVLDRDSRRPKRYVLPIELDELEYATFNLSSEGILSALLATRFEARVVWWRFDKAFAPTQK